MTTSEPWWGQIFNDNEIRGLQEATEEALQDHPQDDLEWEEDDDEEYVEAYINITFDKLADVLNDLHRLCESKVAATETGQLFIRLLGEALAWEWYHGEAPYDEPTADAASWFLPE